MFTPQADRRIPSLMATQHPDNAGTPFWGNSPFIHATEEITEILECAAALDCDEYMWDWEGKFADEAMMEKLLEKHKASGATTEFGRDTFITLRIPNIWEEKTFKLARAYMSVLSGAELAREIGFSRPPVFEFILPMTKRADQLLHIQETFRKTAQLKSDIFGETDFGEGYIQLIPLFESVSDLAECAHVLEEFIAGHENLWGIKPVYLRPFIARSDPALNAGFVAAIVASRLALREMYRIGDVTGVPMYPIIGTGSLPFRGGVNPENIETTLEQYQGVRTVTIQSAFRYDYPMEEVKKALRYIEKHLEQVEALQFSDEEFVSLKGMIDIFMIPYRQTIEKAAPLINELASFVPRRRERVQHIGLFGYNRGVGEIKLPRAITYTAAWYSLGIPPEFIGTGRGLQKIIDSGQLGLLERHVFTLRRELKHAGKFLNRENLERFAQTEEWAREIQQDIQLCEKILELELGPQKDHHLLHRNLTSNLVLKHANGHPFEEDLLEAAVMRKSLG